MDEADVVAITADGVNSIGEQQCHRLISRLTLRQRYVLLRMMAESVLDGLPPRLDAGRPREILQGVQLTHVAHFMPPVVMRRCHIGCGCWRDTAAQRRAGVR